MAPTAKRVSLVSMAIAEMIAFVVAAGTVGYFIDQLDEEIEETSSSRTLFDLGLYGREEFLFFAMGTGFFVAILSAVIAIANLHDKVHWALTMTALHGFCALALLVSASLLVKTGETFDSKKYCKDMEANATGERCYQLTVGVVFGFVSTVLFIGDTIIYGYSLTLKAGISFVNMENIPI